MRRWHMLIFLLLGVVLVLPTTAVADNGPHQGDFNPTTDACAGCHRAHRGQTDSLLVESSQSALCYSCHGTGASGADTNVQDGVWEGAQGTGQGLRGGGFDFAVMDPEADGNPVSGSTTSVHDIEVAGTVWGHGSVSSTANPGKADVVLQCGSCHNPHGITGGDAYRILRPKPKDSDAAQEVLVPDDQTKIYTISYTNNNYRDHTYLDGKNISQWCAQCHTRYLAGDTQDTGDAIFKHGHVTDDNSRKCMACHVAHGTSAVMDGAYSSAVEWPDGSPPQSGTQNSRLLSVNNRGVCYQCHESP